SVKAKLKARWDFDYDGTWDTDWITADDATVPTKEWFPLGVKVEVHDDRGNLVGATGMLGRGRGGDAAAPSEGCSVARGAGTDRGSPASWPSPGYAARHLDMKLVTDLSRFIEADPALAALLEDVRPRLDDDPGHDLAHCMRVALWTIRLGSDFVDPRCAVAAALLHDVVNIAKDSPERADASRRSADLARDLLPKHGFTPRQVDAIAEAILAHSFSLGRIPHHPLGEALQDADRLEALGALGILRTASTGARMNAAYFDGDDPWATARPLDDRAFTIDHFFRKLLHLANTMRTSAGRREAHRRRDHMVAFLRQLGSEIGVDPPEASLAGDVKLERREDEQELVYEHKAAEYDRLVSAEDCDRSLIRELEKLAHLRGSRVLEVGVGTGRITRQLVASGAVVTGFDRAKPMLDLARRRIAETSPTGWTLACADARDLPIHPSSFDVAIAGWVFGHLRHWMPDHWQRAVGLALSEMDRGLVSGGTQIVIETLGTGSATPAAPNQALADYYAWLEERGFERSSIRTDYEFPDVETAAEVTGVFFGAAFAERVRRERWARIPECTGVWSKRKT
ncbi:MAG: methyltransferase domain-containing protein, partial [Polyangiaceae bacterium]